MPSLLTQDLEDLVRQQAGPFIDHLLVPPPAMLTMGTELRGFDREAGTLVNRFPVKVEFLNPYRTMQGGLIAGAIDNTIGPLSMLVAPPNMTRTMTLEYHKPVRADLPWFEVTATLKQRQKRTLIFEACVTAPDGTLLVTATATHLLLKTGG